MHAKLLPTTPSPTHPGGPLYSNTQGHRFHPSKAHRRTGCCWVGPHSFLPAPSPGRQQGRAAPWPHTHRHRAAHVQRLRAWRAQKRHVAATLFKVRADHPGLKVCGCGVGGGCGHWLRLRGGIMVLEQARGSKTQKNQGCPTYATVTLTLDLMTGRIHVTRKLGERWPWSSRSRPGQRLGDTGSVLGWGQQAACQVTGFALGTEQLGAC